MRSKYPPMRRIRVALRAVAVWSLMVFFAMTVLVDAEPGRDPQASLDGKTAAGIVVAVYNGYPYVALSSMACLHAQTVLDRARLRAVIGIGKRTLTLTAGSLDSAVDGKTARGTVAALYAGNEFWVPAERLSVFGLKSNWRDSSSTLELAWERRFFLGARLDKTGGAPKLVVEAAGEIQAKVFRLSKPDRLVIDLEGLNPYDYQVLDNQTNEYYALIRSSMNRPGLLRLVAELRQPVGYRVNTSGAANGRLEIELNTLVYGVSLQNTESGKTLAIAANARPEFTSASLSGPDRIVISIGKADLAVPSESVSVNTNEWLSGFEYNTTAEGRVQVTVKLARQVDCDVVLSRERENTLEVRPTGSIQRLTWKQGLDGFTMTGDGPLSIAVNPVHQPRQLVLNIYHARAVTEEGTRTDGLIEHYTVKNNGPGLVEIALDLKYEAQYSLVYSPDRKEATLSFRTTPLSGKIIVLDPGHGGADSGAKGLTQFTLTDGTKTTLREKDINLDVSFRLRELLEASGARVYLTRIGDTTVPLFSRSPYANSLGDDMFISIHTNAAGSPAAHGFEAFYYYEDREEDRRLARLMLKEMSTALDLVPRRGTSNDLAVLRESQIRPSVLVELGFLTNPVEEARLATDEFRRQSAEALFRAILYYIRGDDLDDNALVPVLRN